MNYYEYSSTPKWPDKLAYDGIKAQFLRTDYKYLLREFSNQDIKLNVNEDNAKRAIKWLNHFRFGAFMLLRQFNIQVPDVNFSEESDHTIGYRSDNRLHIHTFWFETQVKSNIYEQFDKNAGQYMPTEVFLELNGVEEGAHVLLKHTDPEANEAAMRSTLAIDVRVSPTAYDLQDHEMDALSWQTSYTRQYYPIYYLAYQATYDRLLALKSSTNS